MSFQGSSDYSYLNAKIHAKRSKFLSAKDYERIYSATNLEDVYRLISATNVVSEEFNHLILYGRNFSTGEVDALLIKTFQKNYSSLVSQLPMYAQVFLRVYEKRFFIDALKVIIKARHLRIEGEQIKEYIVIPSGKFESLLDQLLKINSIINIIDQIPFPDYKKALQDALTVYEQYNSPLILELALLQTFYNKLWAASYALSLTDRRGVFDIVGTDVDLINTLAIVRGKQQGIDNEILKRWLISRSYRLSQQTLENMRQIQNINQIESILASIPSYKELSQQIHEIFEEREVSIEKLEQKFKFFLVQKSNRLLSTPFQLGIFFSYIHLSQTEFANIRAIIIGKLGGLSIEDIKNSIIYF